MRDHVSVRFLAFVLLAAALLGVPAQTHADAAWLVFRDTIGGSMAGLLVGGAIALIGEDSWEPVRVGFIAGTFAGLGLGVYQAVKESRSEEQSLLDFQRGEPVAIRLVLPEVTVQPGAIAVSEHAELTYRMRLVSVSF